MDLQSFINIFKRWYNDQPLSLAEADFIPLIISTCTASVLLVVMLIWMDHICLSGIHIKWFFEDICHGFGWYIGSYNVDLKNSSVYIHTKNFISKELKFE